MLTAAIAMMLAVTNIGGSTAFAEEEFEVIADTDTECIEEEPADMEAGIQPDMSLMDEGESASCFIEDPQMEESESDGLTMEDTIEMEAENPEVPSDEADSEITEETEPEYIEETESGIPEEEILTAAEETDDNSVTGVTYSIRDGILTFSGTGAIDSYHSSKIRPPWYDYSSEIYKIIIEEGITEIGEAAFHQLENVTEVTIASSVKRIGTGAFCKCSALSSIIGMEGVDTIGQYAFQDTALTAFTIPAGVTKVDPLAFFGCKKLTSVKVAEGNPTYLVHNGILYSDRGKTLELCLPGKSGHVEILNGVTKIGSSAFLDAKITSVSIPSSVTEIGDWAFSRSSLTSLTVPASVTKLGNGIVSGSKTIENLYIHANTEIIPHDTAYQATGLKEVVITGPVRQIDSRAFRDCTALVSAELPDTLKIIGVAAFMDDAALVSIQIPDGIEQILVAAFDGCTSLNLKIPDTLDEVSEGVYIKTASGSQSIYEDYTKAFEVLALVNKERAKAGAAPLKMDTGLLESAMMRANETTLVFSHTRPCGLDCTTANSKMSGENISYGSTTAEAVMSEWMNSSIHKANILGRNYKSIGVGCVRSSTGVYYWVQCFSINEADEEAVSSDYTDSLAERSIILNPDAAKLNLKTIIVSLFAEETSDILIYDVIDGMFYNRLNPELFEFTSSDPSIASIVGNKVTAHRAGDVTISAALKGCPASKVSQVYTVDRKKGSISVEQRSYYLYGSEDDQTVQITASANSGKTLFWSSDADWAKVDDNGLVTITGGVTGDATITAVVPETEVYSEDSAKISIHIEKRNDWIIGDYYTYKTIPQGIQSFKLPYAAKSGAKLTYSSDVDGVTFAPDGTMTVSGNVAGEVKVEISTDESNLYKSTAWTVYVNIRRSTGHEEGTDPQEHDPGSGPHTYGSWEVYRAATVFKEGTERQYCSCGTYRSRSIRKLKASVRVNYTSIPLRKGQKTSAVRAYGLAAGDRIISWTSSNKKVATVDRNGKITAKKKTGTAVITVRTKAGATASVRVKVQKKKVKASKISFPGRYLFMFKGTTATLDPIVTPVTATGKFKYKSSRRSVAKISKKGVVSARKRGQTDITVTYGGKSVKITVIVM